jgi:hypothetical protein
MIARFISITLLATTVLACDKKDEPVKADPVAKKATASDKTTDAKKPAPTTPEVAPTTAAPDPAPVEPAAGPLGLDDERIVVIATAARELESHPEDSDEVLERHGLDRPSFEAAVTEIAKDPWKSDLYIAALGQAPAG